MKLTCIPKRKNEYLSTYRYKQTDESVGVCASTALICIRGSRFAGKFIPTMTVADVSTLPEYRNRGLVREIIMAAHRDAARYGAYVSLLHPFSFDFYRKFGYERISDTVSATFEIAALDNLTKSELIPINEIYYEDIISLFRRFSINRNLMLDRYAISTFLRKKSETYLCLEDKKLCGYIVLEKDSENRKIKVSELVFDNENILTSLISYLKFYSNDFDTVEISDVEPIPEIYGILERFHAEYVSKGDLMARLIDTEGLLSSYEYPDERGSIIIKVDDDLESAQGTFKIDYEKNKAVIKRISPDERADVLASSQALLRLIYGCENAIDGVRLTCEESKIKKIFPKRINGLFEHF